tara:strand:+ start:298 stop:489 length:192 start_codon:yes stop_codon:yes gene_type:complete
MDVNYYKEYYNTKKHLYKLRYEERKIERKKEKELFEPYGGKEKYYRDKILEFISLYKTKKDEE